MITLMICTSLWYGWKWRRKWYMYWFSHWQIYCWNGTRCRRREIRMSHFDPLCNGGCATIQRRCRINANILANVIKHPNYYQHVDKVEGKVIEVDYGSLMRHCLNRAVPESSARKQNKKLVTPAFSKSKFHNLSCISSHSCLNLHYINLYFRR